MQTKAFQPQILAGLPDKWNASLESVPKQSLPQPTPLKVEKAVVPPTLNDLKAVFAKYAKV
jgi:hypothetical protein